MDKNTKNYAYPQQNETVWSPQQYIQSYYSTNASYNVKYLIFSISIGTINVWMFEMIWFTLIKQHGDLSWDIVQRGSNFSGFVSTLWSVSLYASATPFMPFRAFQPISLSLRFKYVGIFPQTSFWLSDVEVSCALLCLLTRLVALLFLLDRTSCVLNDFVKLNWFEL